MLTNKVLLWMEKLREVELCWDRGREEGEAFLLQRNFKEEVEIGEGNKRVERQVKYLILPMNLSIKLFLQWLCWAFYQYKCHVIVQFACLNPTVISSVTMSVKTYTSSYYLVFFLLFRLRFSWYIPKIYFHQYLLMKLAIKKFNW
jgi:hypothetical protein